VPLKYFFWCSGAHLQGFAPGPTFQVCSGGESLATCVRITRFDRLGIWNPYLPIQTQTSYHLCWINYDLDVETSPNCQGLSVKLQVWIRDLFLLPKKSRKRNLMNEVENKDSVKMRRIGELKVSITKHMLVGLMRLYGIKGYQG